MIQFTRVKINELTRYRYPIHYQVNDIRVVYLTSNPWKYHNRYLHLNRIYLYSTDVDYYNPIL